MPPVTVFFLTDEFLNDFFAEGITNGIRTIAPRRVLIPLNVLGERESTPTLCAVNENPHMIAVRSKRRLPFNFVFICVTSCIIIHLSAPPVN